MPWSYEVAHVTLEQLNCYAYKGISLVSKYTPMEVIFNYDLLLMKIKITYLILSPLVICYFRLILIFDLDHFLCDLPYLWLKGQAVCNDEGFSNPWWIAHTHASMTWPWDNETCQSLCDGHEERLVGPKVSLYLSQSTRNVWRGGEVQRRRPLLARGRHQSRPREEKSEREGQIGSSFISFQRKRSP